MCIYIYICLNICISVYVYINNIYGHAGMYMYVSCVNVYIYYIDIMCTLC